MTTSPFVRRLPLASGNRPTVWCSLWMCCFFVWPRAHAQDDSSGPQRVGTLPSASAFLKGMPSYERSLNEQAVGFLVGGGLGVGISLTLATRAEESLSKTGLSVLAASSTLGMINGVHLLVKGDGILQEAENLLELDRSLRRAGVSFEKRERLLDESLLARLRELRRQRDDTRLWNGLVSLVVSAGGGAALALSRNEATSGQLGLALFTLTTGVYGFSSLIPRSGARGISELQADLRLELFPAGPGATFLARLP